MLKSLDITINSGLVAVGLVCLLSACEDSNDSAPVASDVSGSAVVTTANETQQVAPMPLAESCESESGVDYVCGVINGEDILQLGNSNWLLVSGMDGSLTGNDARGKIHLVDAGEKSAEIFFPGTITLSRHDTVMYPDCPGPIDTSNFSAHGLALQKINKGPEIYRVYMTSHGAREAIEVFEVDAFVKPTIQWVGCIPMPTSSWTNSVTMLADGGFFATQFFDPSQHGIQNVMAGEVTGHVFEWHPGESVSVVAGTELAGPNGITVSLDERWIFVAEFGTGELIRFDRSSNPVGKEMVSLGISPDNVRWTSEGSLYVAGNNTTITCGDNVCDAGWSVLEVTPYNMATSRVGGADAGGAFGNASSALLVNNEIWVGTYGGDRLAILPR